MRLAKFVLALASGVLTLTAAAQPCGHWADGYGLNGLSGRIQASVMFDDGTGAHLYVAGEFANAASSPGRQGIAMWDGTGYVPVGGGLDGSGWSLAVFDDDGAGPNPPALYVGGRFQHAGGVAAASIAKWNGSAWSALGNGLDGIAYALKAFDDGTGPGLYAAGSFTFAGSVPASSIAVWRGGAWSDVGGGVRFGSGLGSITTMEVYQGQLHIGGFFTNAGPSQISAIAKWDGGAWAGLGAGLTYNGSNAQVTRLLAVNLPSVGGSMLIAAGNINNAGGVASGQIVRWNGSGWSNMSAGNATNGPNALCLFDDGSGPAVYAGGVLTPGPGVSKWNGSAWQLVGAVPSTTGVPLGVDTMTAMPGNRLYVGGMFKEIGLIAAPASAFYQGGQWSPADSFGLGTDARINSLQVLNLGDGARLYAAGTFRIAGGVRAAGVARLGPSGWESLSSSLGSASETVRCMAAFNDGSGLALYVGGQFTSINGVAVANVARWRPAAGWSTVGAGLSSLSTSSFGAVHALCVHDADGSGPNPASLFATGLIQYTGATAVTNVVRWTGSTWASVGAGGGPDGTGGACLASIDLDGPGGLPPRLYFGGVFLPIAVWDGTTWTQDDTTPTATVVSAIGAFDFGSGPLVYAGGDFTAPFQGSLARKGAGGWEQVGDSPNFPNNGGSGGAVESGCVQSMLMFDDGNGPALYLGGIFGSLASEHYQNIARFDGSTWAGLGAGLASRFPGTDGRGSALAVFNDGTGPALFVGGKFERYYPNLQDTGLSSTWHAAYNLAKWVTCARVCCADFDADGDARTDADIEAFFACIAGNCCASCCSADYDGDGDTATDADIEAFFRVLAGGNC